MAKIKVEDIRKELEESNWKLVTDTYKNLESELTFKCPEGHSVFSSWKKMRQKLECPICKENIYKEQTQKVIPKKKDTFRVLALDQATRVTGFSIYDNRELIRYGTFETSLDDEIARDNMVKMWLVSMLNNWDIDILGLEDIQLQPIGAKSIKDSDNVVGIQTFKILAHLQGILMETAYEQKVPFSLCPTPTWRAHCQVKGRTKVDKKRSMQLKVKDWFDISVTDDEADAIGIGKYVAETNGKGHEIIQWE